MVWKQLSDRRADPEEHGSGEAARHAARQQPTGASCYCPYARPSARRCSPSRAGARCATQAFPFVDATRSTVRIRCSRNRDGPLRQARPASTCPPDSLRCTAPRTSVDGGARGDHVPEVSRRSPENRPVFAGRRGKWGRNEQTAAWSVRMLGGGRAEVESCGRASEPSRWLWCWS